MLTALFNPRLRRTLCPYCRGTLIQRHQRLVSCSSCKTVHHESCWEEAQRCSIFGCTSSRIALRDDELQRYRHHKSLLKSYILSADVIILTAFAILSGSLIARLSAGLLICVTTFLLVKQFRMPHCSSCGSELHFVNQDWHYAQCDNCDVSA